MSHHDAALKTYLQLAVISQQKQQLPGRDRLLILAAQHALQAGLQETAESLWQIFTSSQPRHLIANYPTFTDAFKQPVVQLFLKQLTRLCPLEKAETLLTHHALPLWNEALDYRQQISELLTILRD